MIISLSISSNIIVLAHSHNDHTHNHEIDHRNLRHSHGDSCGTHAKNITDADWEIDGQAEENMFGKRLRYVSSICSSFV